MARTRRTEPQEPEENWKKINNSESRVKHNGDGTSNYEIPEVVEYDIEEAYPDEEIDDAETKEWNVQSVYAALAESLVGEIIHVDSGIAVIENHDGGKKLFDIVGWRGTELFNVQNIVGKKQLLRKLTSLSIEVQNGWIPIEWSES